MLSSERIQSVIHKLEVGTGPRVMRIIVLVLTVVALAIWYDMRQYRNLATQEAMDSAQVARNLAEGRGYTTFFSARSVFIWCKNIHWPAPGGPDPHQCRPAAD